MTKENLENATVTELIEFESQLLEVMRSAYEKDEIALEIMIKMKKAISSC